MSSLSGSLTDPRRDSIRSSFLFDVMSLWLFTLIKDLEVAIAILYKQASQIMLVKLNNTNV